MHIRAFQPTALTQNVAMDGTAKTITIAAVSDKHGTVFLNNVGTATVFVTLDGVTPTTSNAMPIHAGTGYTVSMPTGALAIKAIGAAGSTLYVTPGTGV